MVRADSSLARRSGRIYTGYPMSEATLHSILEAGLLAPAGRNQRHVELITVTGRENLLELAKVKSTSAAMLKTADAAIVVIGDSERTDTWIEDSSIAMTLMMLRATDLGVANCWIEIRNRPSQIQKEDGAVSGNDYARELLEIPEKFSVLAILSLGMADQQPAPHTAADADFSKVHYGKF